MNQIHKRRKKIEKTLTLMAALCALSASMFATSGAAQGVPGDDPIILRADSDSLLLEWRAPSYVLRPVDAAGALIGQVIESAGWATTDDPGEAPLPYATALVVLPPTGEVELVLVSSSLAREHLGSPLHLTPAESDQGPPAASAVPPPPLAALAVGAWDAVELTELGTLRGHRLARLSFFPFHYDERQQALDVVEQVRVRLRFEGEVTSSFEPLPSPADASEESPLESAVRGTVINPSQFLTFGGGSEAAIPYTEKSLSPQSEESSSRFKIAVDKEGVYELTHAQLSSAGVPLPASPPADLKLEHADQEIAYQWEDSDGNSLFTSGDRLLFYARPRPSRWVDHDIYWLTAGVTGTLMTERSGNPSGVAEEGALWTTEVAESNIGEDNYRSWYPSGRDGDHWYWSKLWRNYSLGIGDYDQTFDVQLLEPESAGTAALTLYLQGEVGSPDLFPDHQVVVHLNGNGPLSETLAWDSDAYFSESLVAPLETLGPGTNQVRLVIPDGRGTSGIDRLWLDAIEVSYPVSGLGGAAAMVEAQPGVKRYTVTTGYGGAEPRIYDVSQISAARVLSDAATSGDSVTFADNDEGEASYFIFSESHITTPGWIRPIQPLEESLLGAEYLIISHSDFITSVAPLAHHRAVSDGLDVRTVSVEAIYDTFGDGRMDPAAIRRCISDTYHSSFPPLLDYVLLVGDGTYDPLDNLDSPYHRPTFIPPYLAYGDPYQGEVTADNRYVTLDGPDDRLPEVSLGRLPVNSPAEAAAVVNKVLMYELEPPLWPWNETLYFFADASEEDNAFHEESDDLYDRAATLDGLSPERRYYCKQDCSQPHLIEGRTEMRRATLDALNRGSLLATWVGHAFWHQWGTDRVFHLEDVSSLHNGGALPVYLQMTCLTSYFSLPDTDALDEALLRLEGGGAVATWGSTSFGLTASHVKMHHGFVGAALGDDPQPLGPSADAGELEAPSSYWDSFVLLGDPAMKLNLEVVPWSHQVALPLVMRGSY